MSATETIGSAEQFASALTDVCNRYMAHLEPSAPPQQYAVTMNVTGEVLNIQFRKAPGQTPFIAFTLSSDSTTVNDETTTARGLFGRG